MSRHDSLRASDADRDAVVDRLREAAGEGRLDPHELEQRVDEALRARTYGDLARLIEDLPGDGRALSRGRSSSVARYTALGAGLLVAVTAAVAVVAVIAMLVVAAAAWWIAVVLFWLVCCGARRRPAVRPGGRRPMSTGHRTRPAGYL